MLLTQLIYSCFTVTQNQLLTSETTSNSQITSETSCAHPLDALPTFQRVMPRLFGPTTLRRPMAATRALPRPGEPGLSPPSWKGTSAGPPCLALSS